MLDDMASVATILTAVTSTAVTSAVLFIYRRWKDRQRRRKAVSFPWFVYDDSPVQPARRSWPPPGYSHASHWGPNGFE